MTTTYTINVPGNRYIPAETRLAVRDLVGELRWHTTRKDVEITDEPAAVPCPMGTGRTVVTIHRDGFQLFFVPEVVRTRLSAADSARVRELTLRKLEYDIPDGNEELARTVRARLSRIAIRTTKSCWLIPDGSVPWVMLDRLTEVGATWETFKYDPSEAPALIDHAVHALRKRVAEQIASNEECVAAFEAAFTAAVADPNTDVARAERLLLARAEGVQKRTSELFAMLKDAAASFGIRFDVTAAATTAAAVSAGMRTRAREFARAVDAARAIATTDAAAMADAAAAGNVDAGVLADFIDENGGDAGALRAAFVTTVSADDDHTFALGGDEADVA